MFKVGDIVYWNGKEFSGHQDIAKQLNAQCFFAAPYHSWERGLNENTNGLVRQYLKKGSSFSAITDVDLEAIMNDLNNRMFFITLRKSILCFSF